MTIGNRIQVKVKAFGILKDFERGRFELKEQSSLRDCVNALVQACPKLKKVVIDPETNDVSLAICAMLNGEMSTDLEAKLADGDELTVFIAAAGG